MPGVQVPTNNSPIQWADWLEISAIVAADGNASRGELEGALRVSSHYAANPAQDRIDEFCIRVFGELGDRAAAAAAAYPFEIITSSVIQLRAAIETYPSYAFCLCLSYCGWERKKGDTVFPERMFEELSALVAKSYVGGDVVRFGYPRKGGAAGLPKAFKEAVQAAVEKIKEGDGCRDRPARSTKDDALDVLAWRHFPDGLSGKLMLVGQCAAGDDWELKLNDLNPIATTDEWLQRPVVSQMLKALFIPHRVSSDEWERSSRRAGIIFDRCRMAHLSPPTAQPEYMAWFKDRINTILVNTV